MARSLPFSQWSFRRQAEEQCILCILQYTVSFMAVILSVRAFMGKIKNAGLYAAGSCIGIGPGSRTSVRGLPAAMS